MIYFGDEEGAPGGDIGGGESGEAAEEGSAG